MRSCYKHLGQEQLLNESNSRPSDAMETEQEVEQPTDAGSGEGTTEHNEVDAQSEEGTTEQPPTG